MAVITRKRILILTDSGISEQYDMTPDGDPVDIDGVWESVARRYEVHESTRAVLQEMRCNDSGVILSPWQTIASIGPLSWLTIL